MSAIPGRIIACAREMGFAHPEVPPFMNMPGNFINGQSADCYYPEGIISTRGAFPPFLRVVLSERWGDVTDLQTNYQLLLTHDQDMGSVISEGRTQFRATFNDGKHHTFGITEEAERTLASDFFRYGIRDDVRQQIKAARFTRRMIEDTVADAQLPYLEAKIRRGLTVPFGKLMVNSEGVTYDGAIFQWETVQSRSYTPSPTTSLRDKTHLTITEKLQLSPIDDPASKVQIERNDIHNASAFDLLFRSMQKRSRA